MTATVIENSSITGKIFNLENKQGVPGLLVTVYDINSFSFNAATKVEEFIKNGTRFASFTTNANGEFSYNYSLNDILSLHPDKKRVDLFLVVTAHDDDNSATDSKVLFFTNPPRFMSGKSESFNIGISKEILIKFGVIADDGDSGTQNTVKERINAYVRANTDQQLFDEGIAAYHKQLIQKDRKRKTAFSLDFKKKIATNYDVVSKPPGVLIKEGNSMTIQEAVQLVAENTLNKANTTINEQNKGVPVYLYLTADDRQRLFGAATSGEVQITEEEVRKILLRSTNTDNPGTILIQGNPIMKFCRELSTDETQAKKHTGLTTGENHDDEHHDPDHPADPQDGGSGPDGPATTIDNATLPKYIARLINAAPSPDQVLKPEFNNNQRADQSTVEKSVDNFSLNKGPAEVPAFYDFHSLQIAFDFVWRQLLDEEIVNLAYRANTLSKAKFGTDLELANLNNQLGTAFPVLFEVPATTASQFEITKEEYNELDQNKRAKLNSIAQTLEDKLAQSLEDISKSARPLDEILATTPFFKKEPISIDKEKYLQKLRETGERIIDTVRQDDYYSLHKTLRDLNDRIKSQYEFTIFAADKDYHSVNFGLLNTFRQKWTPLTYQAGKLVKTMALSPKEERKYSLKVTRNLKRSSKEALKNNTSVTTEQTSTTRIESDIIQKAQNKTNFTLSADGDYNLGVSKGTYHTSFGVDAQNESSQSRKDFHEAVLKAVQDYKEERIVEVNTEEITSSEYNESGTIVNPNDELAVTYLFYELQLRYLISERIDRVMPVVLVAQEVPSPDQITESWVISNSWIINRYLLDDSFRPCLRYLTTKSVGDDFEVRELKRNLQEQRNLVNILKIEVANASRQADNRYRALQDAINKRIREEAAENSDGWLEDSFESEFGGGENPEAAKARELAAKDELQHATEKTEKLSATLQQEVNNLHKLTSEYTKAVRSLLDSELQVKHLLVHLRNNILYYMQVIWSMEPPDQRFLRLHKVQAPDVESDGQRTCTVQVTPETDIFQSFRKAGTTKHRGFLRGKLKTPVTFKPLAEVADLDTLLGFKGNYMIFPLKQHNALTEFMAAPYIDTAFGAMDPDQLSNVSLEDYSRYVCCLHDNLTTEKFEELKPVLAEWLKQLLADPLRNGDEIVVPTDSLFIEALPSVHPLLENFKLRHRELDVYKVLSDIRKAELENLRLAARLVNSEREDPDVEKKIIVDGKAGTTINVDDHT